MTPILCEIIDHASAWRAADLPTKDAFSIDLERRHLDALAAGLGKLRRAGAASYDGIDEHGFDLDAISGDLGRWLDELRDGRGLINLRGFPVGDFEPDDIALMYYGIGHIWGQIVSQSVMGDRIGHMIAVEVLLHGTRRRSYKGTHEMRLHSDFCDILGMLCIRPAAAGGESRYSSGAAIHNALLLTRPELLEPLYRGIHFWRLGEMPEEPVTPYRVPLFSSREGRLSVHCAGDWSFIKPENTKVTLSALELEAIDAFVELAESEDIRLAFRREAGDCLFANNLIHLHGRSRIENPPDPAPRRYMLPMWVDCPPGFRPSVPELRVFGHGQGIPPRPEMVHLPGVKT